MPSVVVNRMMVKDLRKSEDYRNGIALALLPQNEKLIKTTEKVRSTQQGANITVAEQPRGGKREVLSLPPLIVPWTEWHVTAHTPLCPSRARGWRQLGFMRSTEQGPWIGSAPFSGLTLVAWPAVRPQLAGAQRQGLTFSLVVATSTTREMNFSCDRPRAFSR